MSNLPLHDISNIERAAIIRDFQAHRGWALLLEPALAKQLEILRDMAILPPNERRKEYVEWSIDRLGGMANGIGFARKFLQIWLDQYDAAERAANDQPLEEVGHGHPYAEDPGLATLVPGA